MTTTRDGDCLPACDSARISIAEVYLGLRGASPAGSLQASTHALACDLEGLIRDRYQGVTLRHLVEGR